MSMKISSPKINYTTQHKTRRRMVSYLKLGSCKVILGKKRPDEIVQRRRRTAYLLTGVILAVGLYFIFF